MNVMTLRQATVAVSLLALPLLAVAACVAPQDADRAYAREKCQAYGSEESEAFRACADEALRHLYRTRSFRTVG